MADGDGDQTEGVNVSDLFSGESANLGWTDLSTLAQEGHLLVDDEDGAASAAAQSFGEAVGYLNTIEAGIKWTHLLMERQIGLESWELLSAKVDQRSEELGTVVSGIRSVMEDIYNSLIAAGKAYAETEDVSAAAFDSLAAPSSSLVELPFAPAGSDPLRWDGIDDEKPVGMSEGLTGLVPYDTALPRSQTRESVEDPQSMTWDGLYSLGQSIRDSGIVTMLQFKAERWWQMATLLDTTLVTPQARLTKIVDTSWQGLGAGAAVAAVDSFIADANKSVNAIRLVGDLINFMSEWASDTEKAMPPSADYWQDGDPTVIDYTAYQDYSGYSNPTGTVWVEGELMPEHSVEDYTKTIETYRDDFRILYRDNLLLTDESVPEIPIPANPTVGEIQFPTDPTDTDGGDDITPAGGGTNPGGGGIDPGGSRMPWTGNDLPMVDRSSSEMPNTLPAGIPTPDDTADQQQPIQQKAGTDLAQQGLSAAQSLAEQGLNGAQKSLESALQAAEQNTAAAPVSTYPGTSTPASGNAPSTPLGGSRVPASGAAPSTPKSLSEAAKLFPRASMAGISSATPTTVSTQSPTMGSPGSPGSPGAAGRGQQDERHKRPRYLESTEHLEQAMGEALDTTRPVAGAAPARPESTPVQAVPVVVPAPDRAPAPNVPAPHHPAPQTVPAR